MGKASSLPRLPLLPTFFYFSYFFTNLEWKFLLFRVFWPFKPFEPCGGHSYIYFYNRYLEWYFKMLNLTYTSNNKILLYVFSYSGLSVVWMVWMEQLQRGLWKRHKNQSQVNTAISPSGQKIPIRLTQANYISCSFWSLPLSLYSKTSCRIIASKREVLLYCDCVHAKFISDNW